MDLSKILAQLHEELENLDRAIRSLELLELTDRRTHLPDGLGEISRQSGHRTRKPRAALVRKTAAKTD
jgi:hypothetical protein